jgi:CBS domain-containing protein
MRNSRIADWMSAPPIVISPATTLGEAQHLMEARRVRRLPVVQDGRLVGIVTWGDLRGAWPSTATTLSAYEWRALLERATVSECMTHDPITIDPQSGLHEAARIMVARKIGGLPVVVGGQVVGIITESDLLRRLVAEAEGGEPGDP